MALLVRFSDYQQKKRKIYKSTSTQNIQTLREQSERLSAQNKFIATLTHEIRNIVTKYIFHDNITFSIVTNANFLKESGVWNNEAVIELSEASEVLSEILNNTLDIAKLEEGKIEFNRKYEQIRSVTDVVLNVFKANATKKEIHLSAVYDTQMPQLLEFDKARVTQVIMNLVGNAIKFTKAGGLVTIKASWKSSKDVNKSQIVQKTDPAEPKEEVKKSEEIQKPFEKAVQNFALKANANKNANIPNIIVHKNNDDSCNLESPGSQSENSSKSGNSPRLRENNPIIEENHGELPETPIYMKKINFSGSKPVQCTFNNVAKARTKHIKHFSNIVCTSTNLGSNTRIDSPDTPEKVPDESPANVMCGLSPKMKVENHKLLAKSTPTLFGIARSMGRKSMPTKFKYSDRLLLPNFPLPLEIEEIKERPYEESKTLEQPALRKSSSINFTLNKSSDKLEQAKKCITRKNTRNALSGELNTTTQKQTAPRLKISDTPKDFRMSNHNLEKTKQAKPSALQKTRKERKSRRNQCRQFDLPRSVTLGNDDGGARLPELIQNGMLVLEISDTGCGIESEEIGRLFKPFSQANKGVYGKFGGTGLGLWLCHKLISAMQGTIECKSIPNKGTTFTISLPVKYKPNETPVIFQSVTRKRDQERLRYSRI